LVFVLSQSSLTKIFLQVISSVSAPPPDEGQEMKPPSPPPQQIDLDALLKASEKTDCYDEDVVCVHL